MARENPEAEWDQGAVREGGWSGWPDSAARVGGERFFRVGGRKCRAGQLVSVYCREKTDPKTTPKTTPKRPPNDPQTTPKRPPNDPVLTPRWPASEGGGSGVSWLGHAYSVVKERRGRLREEANTVGCPQRRPTGGIRRQEGDFGREISGFRRLAEGVAGEGVVALRFFGK